MQEPDTGEQTQQAEPTGQPQQAEPTAEAVARRRVNRVTGPFDALQIVKESDVKKADAALESLSQSDSVDQQILQELADIRPLADPGAFPAAHRTFVRALEVYSRNAGLRPTRLPAGILRPVATPVVAMMTGAIARSYQKRITNDVRRLYAMREATSVVGSPEHRMLVAARRQLDHLSSDLSGNGFAIPAFLLGGAVLSAVASVLQDLLHSRLGRIALLVAVLILTIGAFWCIVSAAALIRRRTRLVLDQPLAMLYQTVGAAGQPPHEPSRAFVAIATVLLVLGWIIAPLVVALFSRFI